MISLFATLQTQTMEVTDTVTAVAGNLAQPVAQAAPAAESLSFWELCVKGGFIMIPLALLLIVSIYVFIERWLAIRRADKDDNTFMIRIKDYILDGDPESAQTLCDRTNTPYSRLIAKGISRLGRPMNDVLVTIENTGNIEVANLGKRLPWLATTAAGAPMLGFLGTVWGMVQAFYNLAKAGTSANIDVLAGGIYGARDNGCRSRCRNRGALRLQLSRGPHQRRYELARIEDHGVHGPSQRARMTIL